MITNIVLNIPHSSAQNYDTDEWSDMDLLHEQVNEWTDWFTDCLFRPSIKGKCNKSQRVQPFTVLC